MLLQTIRRHGRSSHHLQHWLRQRWMQPRQSLQVLPTGFRLRKTRLKLGSNSKYPNRHSGIPCKSAICLSSSIKFRGTRHTCCSIVIICGARVGISHCLPVRHFCCNVCMLPLQQKETTTADLQSAVVSVARRRLQVPPTSQSG